ncbi:MAG: anti-sigma factor [Acidimicrobiia bacterium]|nr:anti-sigma factor [Acidimicrobiia bacterium]
MDDVHDLTALYIVDALDDLERRRYEAHLEDCAACQDELAELGPGFDAYLVAAAEPVPPAVKAAVMARVAEPTGLRRFGGWAVGVAAAAAAVSVVVAVALGGEPDLVEQVYAAPDVVVLEVESPPFPGAAVVYSREVGRVLFTAASIPNPGPGRTYQLWLIDDQGPSSAGTFLPGDGETVVVLDGTAEPGQAVGLTVEPEGGSQQPTGEILMVQPLA